MFKALEEFEPDIKVNGALIFFLEKILDLLLPFHGERERFWTKVLWRKKEPNINTNGSGEFFTTSLG